MDAKVQTSTTPKAKLSVRNLNFFYGKFHALKNVNMELPENKVTAFIGPSGCRPPIWYPCCELLLQLRNVCFLGSCN